MAGEVWQTISEHVRPGILTFLRLSWVCKASRKVFKSDKAWEYLNTYGLSSGIADAFTERMWTMDEKTRLQFLEVWCPERKHVPGYCNESPDIQLGLLLARGGFSDAEDGPVTSNRQVMWCAVHLNPWTLRYGSADLKKDPELALIAVSEIGLVLEFLPDVSDKREIVLAAVQNDGASLKFASKRLQDDRELVLAAVNTNGDGLQYASSRLKADKEVVIAAVSNDPDALVNSSFELWEDRDVVLAVVSKDGGLLQVHEQFQDDKEIVRAAVSSCKYALRYSKLTHNKDIVLHAVNCNSAALAFASEELKKDPDILAAARSS